jgi:hypothetical protein
MQEPIDNDYPSMEDMQIHLHEQYIKQVNESGLPLWMSEQYEALHSLEEEELDNRELDGMMDYHQFKNSHIGENYCAYHGDWFKSYWAYVNDLEPTLEDGDELPF